LLFKADDNSEALEILKEFDIDFEECEILIRRRLFSDGRSDVRINGVSTTVTMLKKLTASLCDVYGQSEHYSLLQKSNQLKVLDKYIGESADSIKLEIKGLIDKIHELNQNPILNIGDEKERQNKLDLLSYQINEIEKAELKEGEEEDLLKDRKIFKNIEKIGENLQIATELLGGDNMSVDMLSTTYSKLNQLTDFGEEYSSLGERVYNAKAELQDVLSEIENTLDNLDYDGNRLMYIENRLDLINGLKRKYGSDYSEIISYYENAKIEYENIINSDRIYSQIIAEINKNYDKLEILYDKLHKLRVEKGKEFSTSIENELKTLGMKSSKFNIEVNKSDNSRVCSLNGVDDIEFTFSANAGEPLNTMAKVISGGEMSRFMLAMKLVSSGVDGTYIFDEIDAGISGEVANIIAQKFSVLSKKIQIITISHLAQIISYGDSSFKILKTDDGVKTATNIIPLDYDGKVEEIVRIIGGLHDDSSINHAKSLIKNADEFKTL
jgi:DNA repair protein RecN (Recombination protein N)